ncbi:thioredoxin family protein [Sulfurimonas sp.]|uniref:thioredoxin family protein n=1 Tax=Sulfurimonas sp. TaxID=2022749 RepID=UPI002AAF5533|nr:thioredoxin fold domain-containing protein [Sulfurimonas sp.]
MIKIIFKIFLFSLLLQVTLLSREIDINKLAKSASKTNKHLFVWLHKTGCGYCQTMEEFTLDNEKVKALLKKKFVEVHINIYEKDKVRYKDFIGSGRDFAKSVGYNFYPTSLFFDKNAKLVYAVPGYKDENVFYTILKYIDSKSYKKVDFEIYENDFEFKEEK